MTTKLSVPPGSSMVTQFWYGRNNCGNILNDLWKFSAHGSMRTPSPSPRSEIIAFPPRMEFLPSTCLHPATNTAHWRVLRLEMHDRIPARGVMTWCTSTLDNIIFRRLVCHVCNFKISNYFSLALAKSHNCIEMNNLWINNLVVFSMELPTKMTLAWDKKHATPTICYSGLCRLSFDSIVSADR